MDETKSDCEHCNHAIALHAVRYSCQYNCTFCEACTTAILNFRCPNCQGVLRSSQHNNGD